LNRTHVIYFDGIFAIDIIIFGLTINRSVNYEILVRLKMKKNPFAKKQNNFDGAKKISYRLQTYSLLRM
jgi:hypothetical protein